MKSISEQRKIIQAATPGPWEIAGPWPEITIGIGGEVADPVTGYRDFTPLLKMNQNARNLKRCSDEPDAAIIVAARNEYPDLLTWAENARTQLDVFQAVCESAPEPILGDWNWPQLKKEIEQLLAELPE